MSSVQGQRARQVLVAQPPDPHVLLQAQQDPARRHRLQHAGLQFDARPGHVLQQRAQILRLERDTAGENVHDQLLRGDRAGAAPQRPRLERHQEMAGEVHPVRPPTDRPRAVQPEDTERHGQAAAPLDDADEVGVGRVVIGLDIPGVAMTARDQPRPAPLPAPPHRSRPARTATSLDGIPRELRSGAALRRLPICRRARRSGRAAGPRPGRCRSPHRAAARWRRAPCADRRRASTPQLPAARTGLRAASRANSALLRLQPGQALRVGLRMSWLIFMEQNFGPHIEQKCATLCASFGSVSSWIQPRRVGVEAQVELVLPPEVESAPG